MDSELRGLSEAVGIALAKRKIMLACAESCTGGWVAEVVTATAGCSGWFERGFVTYSNEAKQEMLGVPADLIKSHGAVSEEIARAMASGALTHSHAQVALAITGIAGPGGGSDEKPVGTVCFAWGDERGITSETSHFSGERETIRRQAVIHSLSELIRVLSSPRPLAGEG